MSKITLTDAKGMGGVNAQDGFDYQAWTAFPRIPLWLSNPSFEGLIFEGLEDVEARFFAPHSPHNHIVDRYQAKSSMLTAGKIVEVISSFKKFDTEYPETARLQVIVTPKLPSNLEWLARDGDRIHKARPFYNPFSTVMQASEEKLRNDLIAEFGEELGVFASNTIEFNEFNITSRDNAIAALSTSIQNVWPEIDSIRAITALFELLNELASKHRGQLVTKAALLKIFENTLGQRLSLTTYPVCILSKPEDNTEAAICINASGFTGTEGSYPDTSVWIEKLLEPLNRTATWLKRNNISRISLSGQYRLTTAFCVGWSMRSAVGFELEIPTREGFWATDDRPKANEVYPDWQIAGGEGDSSEKLIVSIGIIRDPTSSIPPSSTPMLRIYIPEAITSAHAAQNSVSIIKKAVDQAISRLKPRTLDLYYVGPAVLAVALGHRWNAMPSTQLYEYIPAKQNYQPTALIV